MKKVKDDHKRFQKAEANAPTQNVAESAPNDALATDTLDETVESIVTNERQETHTEQIEEGTVVNNATAPPVPAIEELDKAAIDLFEGATFPTAPAPRNQVKHSSAQVVNHKNGKRITFSEEVTNQLQLQTGDLVNIAVKPNEIFIMKESSSNGFLVCEGRKIYGKELVELITQQFQLDFTGKSTCHLMNVAFQTYRGQIVAIITN